MNEFVQEAPLESQGGLWFTELHRGRAGLTLKVSRMLYSENSDFQRIDVFETEEFGKVLVLYGAVMLSERDEFVYHEMIAHVPLNVHPKPARVLIIGGGDGGTLREVLRHEEVESATMVEIDRQVVEVSQRFFPQLGTAFAHPKAQVIYDDGAHFVTTTERTFDVVLADTSDPVGPAEVLFQRSFYQQVFDRLSEDGVFVPQTDSPFYNSQSVKQIYQNLRTVFPIVRMYLAHIPTYPSALWSFAFCAKRYHPLDDFRVERCGQPGLRYYNAEVHRASFALPNYVKELLG